MRGSHTFELLPEKVESLDIGDKYFLRDGDRVLKTFRIVSKKVEKIDPYASDKSGESTAQIEVVSQKAWEETQRGRK